MEVYVICYAGVDDWDVYNDQIIGEYGAFASFEEARARMLKIEDYRPYEFRENEDMSAGYYVTSLRVHGLEKL